MSAVECGVCAVLRSSLLGGGVSNLSGSRLASMHTAKPFPCRANEGSEAISEAGHRNDGILKAYLQPIKGSQPKEGKEGIRKATTQALYILGVDLASIFKAGTASYRVGHCFRYSRKVLRCSAWGLGFRTWGLLFCFWAQFGV